MCPCCISKFVMKSLHSITDLPGHLVAEVSIMFPTMLPQVKLSWPITFNASWLLSLTCALYQRHKAFPDYWGECGLEGQPSSGALLKYCLIVQINVWYFWPLQLFCTEMQFVLVIVTNLNLASVNLLCTLFNLLCTYCICMLRYLACLFLVYPF